jgi:hypothetical protein
VTLLSLGMLKLRCRGCDSELDVAKPGETILLLATFLTAIVSWWLVREGVLPPLFFLAPLVVYALLFSFGAPWLIKLKRQQ